MKSLIPFALIVLLLAMAAGRWWVRRSLSLLTVEQKARVMDASSTGNVWPLACLAAGFGIFSWVLPGRIPLPYVFGFLAAFLLTLLLVSAGATAGKVIRLSRAGLPQPYVRSTAYAAILFFVALLVLISAVFYDLSAYVSRRDHGAQSSNQAMQLTASKPVVHALSVCHPRFPLRRDRIGLAAADLVSR